MQVLYSHTGINASNINTKIGSSLENDYIHLPSPRLTPSFYLLYSSPSLELRSASTHEQILRTYQSFAETIYSHGVENAYDVKRLIPGNELAKQLGVLSHKHIAEAQEKAVVYQIVYNISSKEAMEEEIAAGRFVFP